MENQTFKCSDVTAVTHSENESELINFFKGNNVYGIICDRVYPLITINRRNKSTDFCSHILFEGRVNDTSRMLLCS